MVMCRIGPAARLRVVDAILSGIHEPGTSHYELLRAFINDETLQRVNEELGARDYRTHEFGDSVLIERNANVATCPVQRELPDPSVDVEGVVVRGHRFVSLYRCCKR